VSLVTGLSTLLGVVIQLVSVPVCLHYWGEEAYGSWLALLSAFMLLRSFDGGFVAYVGNKLNYLYHQNTHALREHLASAIVGIGIISSLQLAFAFGALLFGRLSSMLGVGPDNANDLTPQLGLLVLMGSWVLTGSYLGIVHRLQIPTGRMFQAAWWAMGIQVCQFAAIMAAALLRLTLLQVSVLFAFSQALIYIASGLYIRRVIPQFTPWLRGASIRTGLRDLRHSVFLTSSNLIQQGATNGTVLVLSAFAGPAVVPVFTTVRTLTNLWTTVTTVLTAPLLPDVVRMHVKGEAQKLLMVNLAYWVVVGSLVNMGALLTYPLLPFLYEEWTAHAVGLDRPLLCLLLGSVVVANAGALMALQLNGINSLRIGLEASIARAVLGLGVGALWFSKLGVAGFGLGILLGEVLATLLITRHFIKHEVAARGLRMAAAEYGPVALSTGSVLLFFLGAGFGWWSVTWIWMVATAGVAAGAVWGWKKMSIELQSRLTNMIPRALLR
jgi:O-antigen/teichoic acid export membrane protein